MFRRRTCVTCFVSVGETSDACVTWQVITVGSLCFCVFAWKQIRGRAPHRVKTGTDYCRKVSCGYLTRVVISLSLDLCRDCSKVDDNGQSDIKRCDLSPARRHAHRCGVSDGITAALVMKLEWNREIMWKMCCGLWEYTTVCVPKHLLKNK